MPCHGISCIRSKSPITAFHAYCLLQAHVTDWLEAFAAHPRIGDLDSLKAKFTQFAKSSQTEQATAATASGVILQVLPALYHATHIMVLSQNLLYTMRVWMTGVEVVQ